MPRRSSSYLNELFKQLPSMAEQVAEADSDFKEYAGAPWEVAEMLVRLKVSENDYLPLLKRFGVLNELQEIILRKLLEIRRKYLIQLSKAYFASQRASEISVLGFMLAGKRRRVIRATIGGTEVKSGINPDF